MQSGTKSGACSWRRRHFAAAVALMALVASGALLDAQSPSPSPTQQGPKTTHPELNPARRHKLNAAKPSSLTPAPAMALTPPTEPPKPDWPVNDKPIPAKVTWDAHGLTIDADNSSLDQIMNEVAADTGAKLEGKVGDERVFGSYGPGPARDVISQLLDGTAYNVLLIGDQGLGTPRDIVLSSRPTGPAPANNARNESEEEGEYEPPQQPVPGIPAMRNGFGPPGMPPEQNQQMEERKAEMEQRQEQLREQQQEQPQQPQTPQ